MKLEFSANFADYPGVAGSAITLLTPAVLAAVRQWRYQPALLNGEPVEVSKMVDVNFTFPQ